MSQLYIRNCEIRIVLLPILVLLASAQLLVVFPVQAAASSVEENWPQWRGPLGAGAAPAANPPVLWSETNNIRWKVKIPGSGLATPVIWENQVFIQTAIPTGKKAEVAAQKSDSRPAGDSGSGQARSTSSRLLQRFDTNKDGKINRAEVPEGTLQRVFDRMVERYNLDPQKTYTLEELEKVLGIAARAGGQPRRSGFGRGMGSAKPTESYQFVLLCINRQTGKVIWQQVACEEVPHEGHRRPDGSFASASPVTDGEHVFAYFGSRGLYCYDMTGKLQWNQDFGDMRIARGFGEGSSPTLYGDSIIVNWDNEGDSFIIALHKKTGETLWRISRDERTSWSTPLVVEYDGKPQVVTAASRRIRSYDLASGELNWECAGLTPNVIPSPVAGAGVVYATSGYRGSALLAIRLGHTGELTGTDAVAWSHHRNTPYVPSPLLYGDKLYFFASNNAILSCLDAKSGQTLIEPTRIADLRGVYASPVGASGRVYLVGRNGVTVVINQSDKLELLATNRLNERFDASPAVVGKELFLRGHEYLYCIVEN